MIKLENVDKYYNYHMDTEVHALKNVNLTINDGEMVAIMGVSGSGKSTMLHILGCLDSQTKGKYFLGEYEVCKYSSNTIALIFNPAVKYKMMKKLITKAAEDMLVSDLLKKPVKELSGGQKQRVALARAIVNRPNIILADEPTAALDKNTANDIMNVLINLNKNGKTVVIVTHDRSVAEKCNRIIELSDGEIIFDKENIPA